MKIVTDNKSRPLLSGYQLKPSEREELDYIAKPSDVEAWANETNRFFRYHGQVYDIQQFVPIVARSKMTQPFSHCVDDDSPLLEWYAIQTDSAFTAIVIRFTDHSVNIGSVTS